MLERVKSYIDKEPSISFDQYYKEYVISVQDKMIEDEFGTLDKDFKDINSVMRLSIERLR